MTEPLNRRFARQKRFLRARFSPEGYLGLHFTIGLCLILAAGWYFAALAEDVTRNDPIVRTDLAVASWFHERATPGVTTLARAISFCGSPGFVSVASVLVIALLLWRHYWNRAITLAVTMLGGSLLIIFLKHLFHRQRPVLENPLVTLTSYGFPSGHTMGSTIFYGLFALIVATFIARWNWRVILFVGAAIFVALIGFTRIYLGAHYFSDVIAAITAGTAWLTFCWTGSESIRRRRALRAASVIQPT
ncbi:MAG: phosphatase PAP2 family protein [Chthoniobacterales bacterium]